MRQKPGQLDQKFYDNAWNQWDDMKSLGPSSRHVRRLTLKMIRGLKFKTSLDAGCGAGTLLADIHHQFSDVQLNDITRGFPFYTLYRRLMMNVPENTVSGHFDWKKRLISVITYWLLFLNLPIWGERYYVLCHA